MILLSAPLIHGQDLSKYRNFSLGMSLSDLSKQIGKELADVKVVHEHPALIQQLTWWPPITSRSSLGTEAVQQIRFSFYNGELYRLGVTYDNSATKGLTAEDMVHAMTAKYGTATGSAAESKDNYGASEKVLARWEDAQYSINLTRSSNNFELAVSTKRLDTQAEAASAEAVKLEKEEAPQKELARVKKATVDLEIERQKNVQTFRP
jgi:hypothetical protein